jgi:hypothetical protein
VKRSSPCIGASMPVTHTSPSPWAACASPQLNSVCHVLAVHHWERAAALGRSVARKSSCTASLPEEAS